MKASQAGVSKYLREGSVRRLPYLELALFGAVGQQVVNFIYLYLALFRRILNGKQWFRIDLLGSRLCRSLSRRLIKVNAVSV